jgi:hypothetical protein
MRSTVCLWNFCGSVCSSFLHSKHLKYWNHIKLTNISVSSKVIDFFLCTNVFEFFIWCSDCRTNSRSRTARYFARCMSERRCISLLVLTVFLPCESCHTVQSPQDWGTRCQCVCMIIWYVGLFDKSEYSSLYFDMPHLPCINHIHNI